MYRKWFQPLSDEEIRQRAAYRPTDRIWFWVKVIVLAITGTYFTWKWIIQ